MARLDSSGRAFVPHRQPDADLVALRDQLGHHDEDVSGERFGRMLIAQPAFDCGACVRGRTKRWSELDPKRGHQNPRCPWGARATRSRSGVQERQDVGRLRELEYALHRGYLPAIEAGRVMLFGNHKPVDALIGVKTLAHPGCLIEIEAIAVLDDP